MRTERVHIDKVPCQVPSFNRRPWSWLAGRPLHLPAVSWHASQSAFLRPRRYRTLNRGHRTGSRQRIVGSRACSERQLPGQAALPGRSRSGRSYGTITDIGVWLRNLDLEQYDGKRWYSAKIRSTTRSCRAWRHCADANAKLPCPMLSIDRPRTLRSAGKSP